MDSAAQNEVRARANNHCELCKADSDLRIIEVSDAEPGVGPTAASVLLCGVCGTHWEAPESTSSTSNGHWNCLRESIWSDVPAVQVLSWRLLSKLSETSSWASELVGEVYLDEVTLSWAQRQSGQDGDAPPAAGSEAEPTLDSNGAVLRDGDVVSIIKDLAAKGAGFVAKRGTVVKNIRLTGDPKNIEGRVNKTVLVLKTEFLKKVT